jgi:hypothetical protein
MVRLGHPRKLALFTALSLADLALTWLLLEQPSRGAYESNPVAAWWLSCFGWAGLAAFKASTVLLVAAVTQVVARHRPHAAGRILTFACLALLSVVLYSGSLLGATTEAGDEADYTFALAKERELDGLAQRRQVYHSTLERLQEDLAAGRCALAETMEALEETEYVRMGDWERLVGWPYSAPTVRERLAAHVVNSLVRSLSDDPSRASLVAQELDAQFRAAFGRSVPRLPITLDQIGAGPG